MLLGMSYSGTRTANIMVLVGLVLYIALNASSQTTWIFAAIAGCIFILLLKAPIYGNQTINPLNEIAGDADGDARLVDRGARHLVLMGRHAPDATSLALVQRLQARGVQVLVAQGDVVKQGQPLGHIGATGRVSGPHLHWSMKCRPEAPGPEAACAARCATTRGSFWPRWAT